MQLRNTNYQACNQHLQRRAGHQISPPSFTANGPLQQPSPANEIYLDVEEKATRRYLDRLDKLGLPAQRELLRGAADYILLVNWTPASANEKPLFVGQHWVS